jgi:hypothetical protein
MIPVLLIVRPPPPVKPFDISIAVTAAVDTESAGIVGDFVPAIRSGSVHAAKATESDTTAITRDDLEFFIVMRLG